MLGFFLFLVFAVGVAMIALAKSEYMPEMMVKGIHARIIGGILAAPFCLRLVIMWYANLTTWDMTGKSAEQTTFIASIVVTLLCAAAVVVYVKKVVLAPVEEVEEPQYFVPSQGEDAAVDVGVDEDRDAA